MVTAAAPRRDAEAELNLPPGFRFHPTDEELVAHYLCARAAGRAPPVPIIAEVDLYRHDPWDLPERALFGRREWYFFTPRDRKYPNGSRPNRAAGDGYWKATGADKPIQHKGRTLGIKKALVFYHGKPPRGVKTEWIMHEYRLADSGAAAKKKKNVNSSNGSLRLDDWVLCRLYHKKNEWEKMQQGKKEEEEEEKEVEAAVSLSDSLTPESDIDDGAFPALEDMAPDAPAPTIMPKEEVQDFGNLGGGDDWLAGINLDDLPMDTDFFGNMIASPLGAIPKPEQDGGFPFF